MKINTKHITLATLIALSSTACIFAEQGSGVYDEQDRTEGTFDRVEVAGALDHVKIIVCDCTQVTVSGDDNLLDLVETDLSGETLTISSSGWYRSVEPLTVEVSTPTLAHVHTSGAADVSIIDLRGGDLTVETSGSSDVTFEGVLEHLTFTTSGSTDLDITRLRAKELRFETSGSGDIDARGAADLLEVYTSGSSDVRAKDLEVRDAIIETSGSSDVEVCATESLSIFTSGSSDIDYYCDPATVTQETSGSSDVRAH